MLKDVFSQLGLVAAGPVSFVFRKGCKAVFGLEASIVSGHVSEQASRQGLSGQTGRTAEQPYGFSRLDLFRPSPL